MQIQSSCTESIADKLKVLYEHTVFEKGDPFFLWPQNSPAKWTPTQGICIITTNLNWAGARKAAGYFLWRIRSSHFRLPVPRSSTRGRSISPRAIPISPQNGILSMSMNAFSAPKMTNPLRRDISAPPYWMTPTAEGRDILTLVQMVVDELQAKKARQPPMRRVAGEKHSIQACTSLRPPPGCPLASCRSLTCSDLCFQPLCRALPDRNAGTALQYERIDPASKILQRIGMRAFRLYPPRPHRSGNGNAFRRE